MHEGALQLWGLATPVQCTGSCDARNAFPARVQQAGDDGLPSSLPSISPSSEVALPAPCHDRHLGRSLRL